MLSFSFLDRLRRSTHRFTMYVQEQLTATLYCEITPKTVKFVRQKANGVRKTVFVPKEILEQSSSYGAQLKNAGKETTVYEQGTWRVTAAKFLDINYMCYIHISPSTLIPLR